MEEEDIDSLPFPAYDLIDLDEYQRQLSYAYNHRRQGILLTSRGCAYHCTFCFTHWKGIRLRSAANIFEEIKQLHDQHGIEDFYVVDDIFNVNSKRALKLFDLIVAAGIKIRLYFVNGLRRRIRHRRNSAPGREAPRSGKSEARHRLHSAPERGREHFHHVRFSHRNP